MLRRRMQRRRMSWCRQDRDEKDETPGPCTNEMSAVLLRTFFAVA